jgi:hypothetical protein
LYEEKEGLAGRDGGFGLDIAYSPVGEKILSSAEELLKGITKRSMRILFILIFRRSY